MPKLFQGKICDIKISFLELLSYCLVAADICPWFSTKTNLLLLLISPVQL